MIISTLIQLLPNYLNRKNDKSSLCVDDDPRLVYNPFTVAVVPLWRIANCPPNTSLMVLILIGGPERYKFPRQLSTSCSSVSSRFWLTPTQLCTFAPYLTRSKTDTISRINLLNVWILWIAFPLRRQTFNTIDRHYSNDQIALLDSSTVVTCNANTYNQEELFSLSYSSFSGKTLLDLLSHAEHKTAI
jgi:hypothetical protein